MPVEGAPVLGPNPYVSAAASAGSAAVSLANALRVAHIQHQRLQALQTQRANQAMVQQQTRRADLLSKGAVPYQPWIEQRDASGLVTRTPNPAAANQDPKRVMQFPALGNGMDLYIPDESEIEEGKEKVKEKYEGRRTAPLKDSLAQEAQNAGLDMQPGENYSTGMLGEMNTAIRDHRPKDGSRTINLTDFSDEQGNRVPVMIDEHGKVTKLDMSGLSGDLAAAAGQSSATAAGAAPPDTPDLFNTGIQFPQTAPQAGKPSIRFTPKPQNEKQPKSLHFEKDTNDSGDVTTSAYDPEKGSLVTRSVQKGAGAKRKDPDAPKPPGEAQLRLIEKTKNDRLEKAKQTYRKTVSEAITDQDRQDAAADLRGEQQQAQAEYEQALSLVTGHDVGHNAWADASGGGQKQQAQGAQKVATTTATPPNPATKQTAAKRRMYTAREITAWAKANGRDPKDALARAKQRKILAGGQ